MISNSEVSCIDYDFGTTQPAHGLPASGWFSIPGFWSFSIPSIGITHAGMGRMSHANGPFQIFKKMPVRVHQNMPFQSQNSFSSREGAPKTSSQWTPFITPTKPSGSASASPEFQPDLRLWSRSWLDNDWHSGHSAFWHFGIPVDWLTELRFYHWSLI